jgi:asparagine synthase (glutamine-hydrolysing)
MGHAHTVLAVKQGLHKPGKVEDTVKKKLLDILHNPNSPIQPLIDKVSLIQLIDNKSDYGKPWFGQLMALPQMYAYLIQVDTWLGRYSINLI